MTEHDIPIHHDEDNIQDICIDGEDAGIIRYHALVVSGRDKL